MNTDTKRIQTACIGITAATKAITANPTLIDHQDKFKVAEALEMATPICGQGAEPTADEVTIAIVQQAQAKLDSVLEKIQ